ncbi:MAG TPA: sigma-70 family RNA polymerase sigma factor [Nocardioidaceae bacterium]|nr:sigma-70 family RNA polymerase sigma factor [Nocardioidaceae bacterium]
MRESQRVEFEWVFRSTYPSVLRTTYLVLHDRGRAEEITQDAFLRLCERWRGIIRIDNPEAWVRKVAIRAAIKQAKNARLRPVVDATDEPAVADRLPDVDLARAIATLAPQQRAAVALFYLEDRSVDEVAHLLEVSPSTVKQHLFRARAKLAELLSETEEVHGDVD